MYRPEDGGLGTIGMEIYNSLHYLTSILTLGIDLAHHTAFEVT